MAYVVFYLEQRHFLSTWMVCCYPVCFLKGSWCAASDVVQERKADNCFEVNACCCDAVGPTCFSPHVPSMCVDNLCLRVNPCPVYFCVLPALAHPHQVREPLLIRWLIGSALLEQANRSGTSASISRMDSYLGFDCLHDVLYIRAFSEWYGPVRRHCVSPSGVS